MCIWEGENLSRTRKSICIWINEDVRSYSCLNKRYTVRSITLHHVLFNAMDDSLYTTCNQSIVKDNSNNTSLATQSCIDSTWQTQTPILTVLCQMNTNCLGGWMQIHQQQKKNQSIISKESIQISNTNVAITNWKWSKQHTQ